MTDVREVLRRWQSGQIARNGVADRKTAGRYIEAALGCGLASDSELTDGVVAEVAQRVQSRPLPSPSAQRKELELHRSRIEKWLGSDPPLRLVRVHELLARDGISIAYTTLRRFAHETLGWRERPVTVRVDDPPPADEAQIDFGEMGYVAEDDGTRRKLWVLVVTLSRSRYMFVWPTFAQTCAALIEGLEAAWRFFGGVIKRVVPDNMTSAVVHPHPTEPVLNRAFLEYAQWRGFFVDPARVRRPQDKPRVENQVAYVRERWFAGEKFRADLDELRAAATQWCRDVAGARVHGTTRRVPREVYELEEKDHMIALREGIFDVPTWTKAKVHPDHHAQIARSLYSLPTRFIGKTLDARVDRITVRFYVGGEMVKLHARVAPGKRSTDPADYPVGKPDYALRSVDNLKARAREHGEHVGAFAERLLGGPLPWARMRQYLAVKVIAMRKCRPARRIATRPDAKSSVGSPRGAPAGIVRIRRHRVVAPAAGLIGRRERLIRANRRDLMRSGLTRRISLGCRGGGGKRSRPAMANRWRCIFDAFACMGDTSRG
ncbi:MAG TPA: IS21 family transposase [Polyangiaceae bacterium]|nr:IS21 family transposase [Polyangiaceae bacterium]